MNGLPILSIITWAPFVAALVIMAFARAHGRCWCRWAAADRRDRLAASRRSGSTAAYDQRDGRLPVRREAARWCRRSASRTSSGSTA